MFENTGIPTPRMIRAQFPKDKKILFRPKAIIECYQEIPCQPCEQSCPFNAITIGSDIYKRPHLDFAKCTGCGICIAACPGQAIMVAMIENGKVYFKIPYEFDELPKVGEWWDALDREGKVISRCKIEHVSRAREKTHHTSVITVSLEQPYLYQFITIKKPSIRR